MSLTAFLDVPAHRDRFKPLRPDASILRRTLPPIRIKSTDPKRTYLVGTAFDYLFRIEVQQRAAWAIDTGWVAERVAGKLICISTTEAATLKDRFGTDITDFKVVDAAQRYCREARKFQKQYAGGNEKQAAWHALRIAQLDVIHRKGVDFIDASFFSEPVAEDIQTLLKMLEATPVDLIAAAKPIFLNPNFGNSSKLIGGADADLIYGSTMLDIKATANDKIIIGSLDQMLGYFLLARLERERTGEFPQITRAEMFFPRYSHFATIDDTDWIERPEFEPLENWFRQTINRLKWH